MIVFFLLAVLLCLWGISFRPAGDNSYLSKEQGNSVKGLFILLVFFAHASAEIVGDGVPLEGFLNTSYFWAQGKLGQMCVVMFLFFSGYGVMNSTVSKGRSYVRSIPRHRVLGTLVNFDIAVTVFAVARLIAGDRITPGQYLLALTGWESVGNSNWYIFVIIMCYLSTWLAALPVIRKDSNDLRAIVPLNLIFVSIIFVVLLLTKEPYWYNTVFAYPLGMAICVMKPRLDNLDRRQWWMLLLLTGICFVATYPKHPDPFQLVYTVRTIAFAILAVLLLQRIRIGNPVLEWCGANLFPLYIYQRLPMMFIPTDNPYLYVAACLAITCLLAWLYRFIRVRI